MRRTWTGGVLMAPESVGGGSGSGGGDATGSSGTPAASSSTGSSSATSGGADGTSPAAPVTHDPIPWDQHEVVRTKAEKLQWAERYEDPRSVEEAVSIQEWLNKDPVGYHEYITSLLKRSGHLKEPVAPRAPQPNTDPQSGRPLPDLIIQETGQRLYSAEQQERLEHWKDEQYDKRLAPLEGNSRRQQAFTEAQAMINEASAKLPYFDDYLPEINAAIARDKRLSLEGAYTRVVVPKIRERERAAMAAELKAKANVSSHNPASAGPTSTADTRKLPIAELLRREMTRKFGR